MIAVDTSAFLAIVLREDAEARCIAALEAADHRIISAGTLTEALIVGAGRRLQDNLMRLIDSYDCEIVPVTADTTYRIADIYCRWGKNFHKASLNFGDCFAYDVARQNDCPLLYVGDDFAHTDISSAI